LLTRDHVARCINREVKGGRGSPHGGVFLDIAWIKEKLPNGAEHIKKKLPSMYHQFKELAGVDITTTPMEVGPTTHYVMGGVRVEGVTQMSTVPGLFAAGEVAAGLHGANRLGGNSLSDLLVFGKRAGEHAAQWAQKHGRGRIDNTQVDHAAKSALAPFDRSAGENPFAVQGALQDLMQANVGIVRNESDMAKALDGIAGLWNRAGRAGIDGNREYNPGWHTALDLSNLLTVSEALTRSALDRRESRGGHFREDCPEKSKEYEKHNTVISKNADGSMRLRREAIAPMREDLKKVIEENK
jgi:succinate dehydrogenase / fumarate reductase flavoprotein subunit